jgi:hypothetical protein
MSAAPCVDAFVHFVPRHWNDGFKLMYESETPVKADFGLDVPGHPLPTSFTCPSVHSPPPPVEVPFLVKCRSGAEAPT